MSMINHASIKLSDQQGQGMTEYIVILTALVFTFLAPVSPPSVPDWRSDGVGSRQLECPLDPYNTGAGRPAQCTVIEILSEVLRKRNDGYTYAISSTFYPERKVRIKTDIFGDPDDPGTGGGTPGDPGGSAGDGGEVEPDFGVDSDTGLTVAVDNSGGPLGTVEGSGCVKNNEGETIGQQQPNGEVWKADIACNVSYTSHSHSSSDSHGEASHGGNGSTSHDHNEVIGHTGSLQTNNDVLDLNGNKIGTYN